MIYELLFSATGRSAKVADIIAAEFEGGKTRLDFSDPALSAGDYSFTREDFCIFTTSVYEGRVPSPAVKNLQKLAGNGAKILLVAVFGNRAVDDCLLEMKNEAEARGFVPVAAIEASVQHSIMPQVEPTRPDEQDTAQLKAFAQQVKQLLAEKTDFSSLAVPGNYPYLEMGGIPFKPKANKKCLDCGLCARRCPAQAIPMDNFRITDKEKCINCMRCVEICPVHARDFSPLLIGGAYLALKSKFAGRKPNVIYLPE